jgi:hypothetical protein
MPLSYAVAHSLIATQPVGQKPSIKHLPEKQVWVIEISNHGLCHESFHYFGLIETEKGGSRARVHNCGCGLEWRTVRIKALKQKQPSGLAMIFRCW